MIFIDKADEIKWLKDVHGKIYWPDFRSAILVGNEDWPERVELYTQIEPLVTDAPIFIDTNFDKMI